MVTSRKGRTQVTESVLRKFVHRKPILQGKNREGQTQPGLALATFVTRRLSAAVLLLCTFTTRDHPSRVVHLELVPTYSAQAALTAGSSSRGFHAIARCCHATVSRLTAFCQKRAVGNVPNRRQGRIYWRQFASSALLRGAGIWTARLSRQVAELGLTAGTPASQSHAGMDHNKPYRPKKISALSYIPRARQTSTMLLFRS